MASLDELKSIGGLATRQTGVGGKLEDMGASFLQQGQTGGQGLRSRLAGIAAQPPQWYADRAAVTSNQAFDESQGVVNRSLSRMGINPNSGRFVGLNTQWGLARAAAEAGARTRAQQEADQLAFNRQLQLLQDARQDEGRGLDALSRAASVYGGAAGERAGLAGAYDKRETDASALNATKRAIGENKIQTQINDMLSKLKKVPTLASVRPANTTSSFTGLKVGEVLR